MAARLNRLKALVRFLFTVVFDKVLTVNLARHEVHETGDLRRDLLVIRVDAIGDFILWLDSFRELREFYPRDKWRITLIGNEIWRDLAEELPHADRFWFLDVHKFRRNPIYRASWLKRIRAAGFDTAISLSYSRRALTSDSLCGRSGARERIANEGGVANTTKFERAVTARWFTKIVPISADCRHELERNAAFLSALSGRAVKPAIGALPEGAQTHLHGIDGAYFLVSPSASDSRKCWPVTDLANTAREIHRDSGWMPVLVGGVEDVAVSARLIAEAPDLPWVNLTGKTRLNELIPVVVAAELCLCNDTMLAHMCAVAETQVYVVVGGGHFGSFLPYPKGCDEYVHAIFQPMPCYGCNWNCNHPEFDGKVWPCIGGVGCDTVIGAMNDVAG